MGDINLPAFLGFIAATAFTPGPNNIACASLGMLVGYRQTLRFIAGIVIGFCLILCFSAFFSNKLVESMPAITVYLRYIGAIYICWLAWQTFQASYSDANQQKHLATFSRGFFLQLVNPKGIFYSLAIFTTFLSDIHGNIGENIFWIIFLVCVCFTSISLWTLFGSVIQQYMKNHKLRKIINSILALALLFTAIQISGIVEI